MAQKTIISPPGAPAGTSPLSRAIRVGDTVYVSGTTAGVNQSTGVYDPDIRTQVRKTLETIKGALEAAGSSLADVVSVTTHLRDRSDFADYNDEYRKFFPTDPPARTTVQAALIPPDCLVEITSTAVITN